MELKAGLVNQGPVARKPPNIQLDRLRFLSNTIYFLLLLFFNWRQFKFKVAKKCYMHNMLKSK